MFLMEMGMEEEPALDRSARKESAKLGEAAKGRGPKGEPRGRCAWVPK